MSHPDPDERDLAAVRPGGGEAGSDVWRRLGEVARSLAADDEDMHEPPAGLWDQIAQATARGETAAPREASDTPRRPTL